MPANFSFNKNVPIAPVILCGGSGTRLWPLSRESYPKQFVDLGDGRTLFKDTLLRVADQPGFARPLIICNEQYRFYVGGELKLCKTKADVLLEPEQRNTAPAAALAAFQLMENGSGGLMLIMPSDHHLADGEAFRQLVFKSAPLASAGFIVSFGVEPNGPETGYGYILRGEANAHAYKIREFVEKPSEEAAQTLLEEGCYWNAGIFLMRPDVYLRELERHAPEIYNNCQEAWRTRTERNGCVYPGKDAFLASPEDSIDYAVMEKTEKAVVAPMPLQWDDLGSWESFFRYTPKDGDNNACLGEVIVDNVKNSYIRASDRLVAAIGVDDLTVVETRDAVLVARREDGQKVKNIVGMLKRAGSSKFRHHPLVYRPWGSYETLATGDRFQVKRIVVTPGESLSLQKHHHRAEHWIVVSGTAEVTNGEETVLYTENQSAYIPIGAKHRLRNPGLIPLVLIEIQSGSYLGEDDIIRFDDEYGRKEDQENK